MLRRMVIKAMALAIGITPLVAQMVSPAVAHASTATQSQVVSAIPQAGTPGVDDGTVFTFAQVGNTMVVGGSFTSVSGVAQRGVFAFDLTSKAVLTGFAPVLDGAVQTVWPGPTAGTVYVGGEFNNVGGVKAKGLVLLNLNDGSRVATFKPIAMNGIVNSVKLVGSRLFVGGTFTSLGGVTRYGLASVSPTTGAVDSFAQNAFMVNHNWTAAGGGAKAPVGIRDLDVTPDGSTMVVIGNFKNVDGLARDQVAVLDLTSSQSVVRTNWATDGYTAACYSGAFDSYVRDIDISPDGTWFAIAATGGGNSGLCDTTARFELGATGTDIPPTWKSVAGGDSILSVAIAGSVVYSGGHERWMNNRNGNDAPGGGAVPRPGLVAMDARTGVPIAWNPGRNPRGSGAWATYITPAGLWVGSDTDWIGDHDYKRMKLAFFPLAGGTPLAAETSQPLPGGAYIGNSSANSNVLYRVNAGGPALQATDDGPDWSADDSGSSVYRNDGSNAAGWQPGATTDSTVPSTTPNAIFDSERWDPGSQNDGGEMAWHFPVPAGQQVDVRVYLANRCGCTSGVGQRVFDVSVEGTQQLTNFDLVAAAGDQVGTMRHWTVTSDGSIDLSWIHEQENPLVNGLEIVKVGGASGSISTFGRRDFTGTSASMLTPLDSPLSVTTTRGSMLLGGRLFYGTSDGNFHVRTFDGKTYGADTLIDPYNDPKWSSVDTGSGQTFRGTKPSFYSEIPNLTSIFFDSGNLYYTLYGQSSLYYRAFSPDSGIVAENSSLVPGVSLPDITGAFLASGKLYYATRADGNLSSVTWTGGTTSGSATTVSGPGSDGVDWRGRVLFLGPASPKNALPHAAFTSSCTGLTCRFDASASTDSDGTIASYSWDFGDSGTANGPVVSHTYAAAGTFTASVIVTDNSGGTNSAYTTVSPAPVPTSSIAFRATSSVNKVSATPALTVPTAVASGDRMLLIATSGTATSQAAPSGWTQVAQQSSSTVLTTVWQKIATAADAGSTVTVTLNASTKVDVHLMAYSGASSVAAVQTAGAATGTSHIAPSATVGTAGSWVVRYWADKSSGTTTFVPAAGVTTRDTTIGTGTGYISAVVADSGGPVGAGPSGTAVASTDASSSRDETATVVLAP